MPGIMMEAQLGACKLQLRTISLTRSSVRGPAGVEYASRTVQHHHQLAVMPPSSSIVRAGATSMDCPPGWQVPGGQLVAPPSMAEGHSEQDGCHMPQPEYVVVAGPQEQPGPRLQHGQ